jgi:hypothetical protein
MTKPLDPPGAMQRRALLKKAAAAGAVVWVAPVIDSFVSVAASQSGPVRTITVPIVKTVNGNTDPPLSTLCTVGGAGNAERGTAVFTRTDSPDIISVTITLSTGTPSAVGRQVFILQSSANVCNGGTLTEVGTWAGGTSALGPQTFSTPILSGTTAFVVALQLVGGGGNDGWSSHVATLL